MKFIILEKLKNFFSWLEDWARTMKENCSYCPDCGKNKYHSPPCVRNVREIWLDD